MPKHLICQSFVTDCENLIVMIKELHAWPSFATELEKLKTLRICFSDLKITHIPHIHNGISNFLAKTGRSLFRELIFVGCFILVLLPRTPQVWVTEWTIDEKDIFVQYNRTPSHYWIFYLSYKENQIVYTRNKINRYINLNDLCNPEPNPQRSKPNRN